LPRNSANLAAIETLLGPICGDRGVALVDVSHRPEMGGAVLRVLIEPAGAEAHPDSEVSVTLEQCTGVSRALSAVLDEDETLVLGTYRLEVSSPGIERPLVKASHYARFVGREIKLQTRQPVEGRRRFAGTLRGIQDDTVQLDVDGQHIDISLTEISKANLVHRF